MKPSSVVTWSYFTVSALAGTGDRVTYEKLRLYYAYQIDYYNEPKDRRGGVTCTEFDETTMKCAEQTPKYAHCDDDRSNHSPCTLREFLQHIKSSKKGDLRKANVLPGGRNAQDKRNFEPDEGATNARLLGWDGRATAPWAMIKDGNDYNEATRWVFAQTRATLEKMNEAASKRYAFFKAAFETCSDKIYKARIWDHHPYLITKLEHHFNEHYPDEHITVEYDEHGYDRYGKELFEFNLEDTIANNRAKLDNIEDIVQSVLDDFYKAPGPGQESSNAYTHKEVLLNEVESMNKFKRVSCGI